MDYIEKEFLKISLDNTWETLQFSNSLYQCLLLNHNNLFYFAFSNQFEILIEGSFYSNEDQLIITTNYSIFPEDETFFTMNAMFSGMILTQQSFLRSNLEKEES